MLRDTSLLYELLLTLKAHRYINHDVNIILDETYHQKERIYDYLDDVSVELFFEHFNLKRIPINPDICFRRYTSMGFKEVTSEEELDLSIIYDRYTFLSIITNISYWKKLFSNNRFVDNIGVRNKRFSACSDSLCLTCSALMFNPYVNAFKEEYCHLDLDFNRVVSLYCFADFHHDYRQEIKHNIPSHKLYAEIVSDYAAIKDQEIFKGVTVEYALSIYCILCEKINLAPIDYWGSRKLKISDFSFAEGITPILAFGLDNSWDIMLQPLKLFYKFELNLNCFFNKDYIDVRDCYLHFVNPEESKAFKFFYHEPLEYFVNIKLFNEAPVKSALLYNPNPLPYLYSKINTSYE
ncbi:MAG: hypothetical protein K2H60_14390 [Muribaculaceae bacterium]|nr:hypothetical protein [Muribaculaceae bacterium]